MSDELDIDAIEKRANAASPGPWRIGHTPFEVGVIVAEQVRNTDATFIAHARQDIPALIAEIRRLRADTIESLSLELERAGLMSFAEAREDLLSDIERGPEVNGFWRDYVLAGWDLTEDLATRLDTFVADARKKAAGTGT